MRFTRYGFGFVVTLHCAEIEATKPPLSHDAGDAAPVSDAVADVVDARAAPDVSDTGVAIPDDVRVEVDIPRMADAETESATPSLDASPDVTTPTPCDGRLFCDDFEGATTGQAPAAPWKIGALEKGHVTIDETRASSGRKSVRFTVDAMLSSSDISRHATIDLSGAPLFPLAGNKLYGRFMLYTTRIPPYPNHWTTAQGSGPVAAAGNAVAQYNYGGQGNLMANYYRPLAGGGKVDCWQTKNVSFPTNKWTCVSFSFDGPANEMRYWQDGVEIPELHVLGLAKKAVDCTDKSVDGRWLAPEFGKMTFGWQSYGYDSTGLPHDAWIDDVVLDVAPIPCPSP